MRRGVLIVSLCLILMNCGCNSLKGSRFALPAFGSTKSTPVSSPLSDDNESGENYAGDDGREPLVADSSIKTKHDAVTQSLIDEELKGLPAEERAEWVSYLNSVEASMVPYILKSRKVKEPPASSEPTKEKLIAEAETAPTENFEDSEQVDIQRVAGEEQIPDIPIQTDIAGNTSDVITASSEGADIDEPRKNLEAPTPTTEQGWPDRLKSLADPKRIWPGQGDAEKKGNTQDLTSMLPKILGGGEKSEKKPDEQALALIEEPQANQSEALEFDLSQPAPVKEETPVTNSPETLRIPRGSELWEDELEKLISLLETKTSATAHSMAVRADVRKQIALRMLYLVADQPQLAQQAIPGISVAEQEYWTALFQGLSEYLDEESPAGPAERATATISQLRTAAHHLQEISHLQLRNTTFCSKINSFGSYDPFEMDEFAIGQPVLVYTEVRNFRSEPTVDGFYRTKLKSTVEIYQGGTEGKMVDRNVFAPTEDLCRTLRSDYYHSYRIDLPTHLTPGPHVLKLTVQDELSGKLTTETINFSVY